jgi:hypothetical protein
MMTNSAIISHRQCVLLFNCPHPKRTEVPSKWDIIGEVSRILDVPSILRSFDWISSKQLADMMQEVKATASGQRTCLLVAGAYLEEQISIGALEALAEGFDVHLLTDLILARQRRAARAVELRLFQAGVVPATLRQFLFMWHTAESDHSERTSIEALLHNYDATVPGRLR